MAKVYKRLSELRPARTSSNVFEKTDKYIDGVYDSTSSTNQTYYRFTANTGDDYRGNFNYSNISGKMYMTGGTHLTSSYYVSSEFFGHYITDGTTHYLTSTIGDTNNPNNKRETIWEFIEQTDGTYLIHNYNDETGNHVYLRNDSGQLRGGTLAQATSWTITKNGTNLSIESVYNEKTYRILYLNRAWNLFDVDTVYQTQSHTTI